MKSVLALPLLILLVLTSAFASDPAPSSPDVVPAAGVRDQLKVTGEARGGLAIVDYARKPTEAVCRKSIEKAGAMAAALPADELTRYFAERYLLQAAVEAGNGEFDDCMEFVARANDEITNRWHKTNEKLDVRKADR